MNIVKIKRALIEDKEYPMLLCDEFTRWLRENIGKRKVDWWIHTPTNAYTYDRLHVGVLDGKKAMIVKLVWCK